MLSIYTVLLCILEYKLTSIYILEYKIVCTEFEKNWRDMHMKQLSSEWSP